MTVVKVTADSALPAPCTGRGAPTLPLARLAHRGLLEALGFQRGQGRAEETARQAFQGVGGEMEGGRGLSGASSVSAHSPYWVSRIP